MTCPPPLCMHLPPPPLPLTQLLPPDFLLFPSMPGRSSLRASAHPLQPPSLPHFLQLGCPLPRRSPLTAPPRAWRSLLAACVSVITASQYTLPICILCLPPPPQGYKRHSHKHRVCLTAALSPSGPNLENKNISDDFKEGI